MDRLKFEILELKEDTWIMAQSLRLTFMCELGGSLRRI